VRIGLIENSKFLFWVNLKIGAKIKNFKHILFQELASSLNAF
jgi:hypothetical protein